MNSQRLKLFALFCMTIDHFGVVLNTLHRYNIAGSDFAFYMTDAYWQMRVIGRLAFPIFCFLIAEGCAHSKNIKKYIGRLAIFAIISQIPYQVFWNISSSGTDNITKDFFVYTQGNVLVTLSLGAIAAYFYSKIFGKRKMYYKMLYASGIAASFVAVVLLRGEYDLVGILIILLVYAFRLKDASDLDFKVFGTKHIQVLCCALVTFGYYALMIHRSHYEVIGAVSSI